MQVHLVGLRSVLPSVLPKYGRCLVLVLPREGTLKPPGKGMLLTMRTTELNGLMSTNLRRL